MATQHTSSWTLKSVAGFALVGPGLFILFVNVGGDAARLDRFVNAGVGQGFGLLSSIILAASLNPQRLSEGLLEILVSLWPLLLVMIGAALLRDALKACEKGRNPCSSL